MKKRQIWGLVLFFLLSSVSFAEEYQWSPRNSALSFEGVVGSSADYTVAGAQVGSADSTMGFSLSYDWFFLRSLGYLGVGGRVGYLSNTKASVPALNASGDLTGFFLDLHLSYHLQLTPQQVLVPFVQLGPQLAFMDFDNVNGDLDSSSIQLGVGLKFLLNVLEKKSARIFDTKYGINATYLAFEYLHSMDAGLLGASGIKLEGGHLRFSLRFEF